MTFDSQKFSKNNRNNSIFFKSNGLLSFAPLNFFLAESQNLLLLELCGFGTTNRHLAKLTSLERLLVFVIELRLHETETDMDLAAMVVIVVTSCMETKVLVTVDK